MSQWRRQLQPGPRPICPASCPRKSRYSRLAHEPGLASSGTRQSHFSEPQSRPGSQGGSHHVSDAEDIRFKLPGTELMGAISVNLKTNPNPNLIRQVNRNAVRRQLGTRTTGINFVRNRQESPRPVQETLSFRVMFRSKTLNGSEKCYCGKILSKVFFGDSKSKRLLMRLFRCSQCHHKLRYGARVCSYCWQPTSLLNRRFMPLIMLALIAVLAWKI